MKQDQPSCFLFDFPNKFYSSLFDSSYPCTEWLYICTNNRRVTPVLTEDQ